MEGSAAAPVGMSADGDKRKAAEALEAGPSKKAATKLLAVNPRRMHELRKGAVEGEGPVIYWYAPSQSGYDNC